MNQTTKIKDEDKHLIYYDEMWHDIWHEKEIDEINVKVLDWINLRIKN